MEDNTSVPRRALVLGPGEGTIVAGSGGTPVVIKIRGQDVTSGGYSFMEMDVAPGPGARPHIHHEADEAFYVVDGELTVVMDGESVVAPTGSFVLVPRGTRHTFRNQGARMAKAVFILSPPGFERFFEELAALRQASPTGQVDFATMAEVGQKFATEFFES
jgi:mannose-6-phosphate isomerase-like protein (cupin superfamily)